MSQPLIILQEVANGVIDQDGKFYPFKADYQNGAGTALVSSALTRYYIRSIQISAENEGVHASSAVSVSGYIENISTTIASLICPVTVAAVNGESISTVVEPHILLDEGSALTVTIGIACSYAYVVTTYAEVPA